MELVEEFGLVFISSGGYKKLGMPETRGKIFAYKFGFNNESSCGSEPIELKLIIMHNSLDRVSKKNAVNESKN